MYNNEGKKISNMHMRQHTYVFILHNFVLNRYFGSMQQLNLSSGFAFLLYFMFLTYTVMLCPVVNSI